MTSVFNPTEFLNQSNPGGFSIRRPTLPEKEYPAQLADGCPAPTDFKTLTIDGENRFILSLRWEVLDDEAKAVVGLDKPTVRQDIWLDLDEHGRLIRDKVHNVALGQLLAGMGLNSAEWNWNQVRTVGLCKVKVGLGKPDKNGNQFNEVRGVVKYAGA